MDLSDQAAGGTEKLRLKVSEGNAAGMVVEVAEELIIGRQSDGAGSLGNDIEISRRHARISIDPGAGRYMIEDLGSTNGTYVNGRALDSAVSLEAGDRIEVGASTLIVQVSSVPHTPTSTPVTTSAPLVESDEAAAGPDPAPSALDGDDALGDGVEDGPEDLSADDGGAVGRDVEAGSLAPGLPPLGLTIDFDLEGQAVTIRLADDGGEVRLVHADGSWRLAG